MSSMETKYIDLTSITKLISNNNVVLLELLQDLIKGSCLKHDEMIKNLKDENWNAIRGNAHFLKSNFRYLGNVQYTEILRSIENNANNENHREIVKEQILDFNNNFEIIMKEVSDYITFLKSKI